MAARSDVVSAKSDSFHAEDRLSAWRERTNHNVVLRELPIGSDEDVTPDIQRNPSTSACKDGRRSWGLMVS
jgi:hypothetical protein